MKSLLKKWKKKNNGNSFVVVVVALTFIGILAVALLSVTLMNYKRMAITKKNDSTYYAVEKAADQLKTGIIDEANQALQAAYSKLEPQMKYWNPTEGVYELLPDDVANERLKKYFIDELYMRLSGNTTSPTEASKYAKLCSYITTGEASLIEPSVAGGYLGTNYEFDIKAISDDANDIYKIEIKGLLFEADATANNGYIQNLYTDFEISAPELNIQFNTNDLDSDNFLNYILVAEDGFEIKGEGTNQATTTIVGNIYAGVDWDDNQITFNTAYHNKYDFESASSLNSGIYASNVRLNIQSDDLVTAGNIVADNSSYIWIRGNGATSSPNQIWCRNLITMASDETMQQAELDIDGVMNVYDDLEINSEYSRVNLAGEYYGYNYGSFGGDEDYAKNSYEGHFQDINNELKNTYGKHYNTSSIIINGLYCSLDMTNLTKLTVQGKTHIDMGDDTYVMGESISVKGNQLAYSVPNALIGKVGNLVGIDESALDDLGEAGEVIKRLLTSNTGVNSYQVFPETEYTSESKNGRYFYRFIDDEVEMSLPWDPDRGPVKLTAEQKAEEYIKWYVSEENGYTNSELTTYDVSTGKYGNTPAFAISAIKISDNGDYGKVYSNGTVMIKEEAGVNGGKMLTVGINSVDATLATTQYDKIRDYNFQLRYLRSAQPDDPALGAVASSPIVNFLNVIENTAVDISHRSLTAEAGYLAHVCQYGIVTQYDASSGTQELYSLYLREGEDIIIDRDFKGFIFTTEDVYIKPGCKNIDGMICAGGKVYVEDRSTSLNLRADADVMHDLIKHGFTTNPTTAEWLQKLFKVDMSTFDDETEAVGTINEDKNLRNYNCNEDVTTMNYQKNVVYVGTN
ncbi:MAG: hypothetical protein IJA10_06410 [Lachnospiraceae bacterium]|nr:hypothetical protein [Lachnospiraceae bacterium]